MDEHRPEMHLVQILLPCADNEGHPFGEAEFERVKQELAERYEGVTAYLQSPAEGLWHHDKGSAHDQIVIFEVMVEGIDIADWRQRRAALEAQFRQDRVIIRYMPMALV